MDQNTIQTLRKHLFDELRDLRDKSKPPDLDRSKSICDVSAQIIASGRLEVDFLKVTESQKCTDFLLPDKSDAGNGTAAVASIRGQGNKTIEQLPGGTITTHRIR